MKPIKCCATCIYYWNCKYKNCRSNNWEHWEKRVERRIGQGVNMFEKEAEDSFKCKKVLYKWETDKHSYIDGFKDGAEFGYNKANEWHFVKNELPDEGTYLVVWQNDKGYKKIFILNYEEDDEEKLHWVDDDCEVQDEYVIAWKEIVLPKEIECQSSTNS